MTQSASEGVRAAIAWIRAMPRQEIRTWGTTIDHHVFAVVAELIARHLEMRLRESERPTLPDVAGGPPSSGA